MRRKLVLVIALALGAGAIMLLLFRCRHSATRAAGDRTTREANQQEPVRQDKGVEDLGFCVQVTLDDDLKPRSQKWMLGCITPAQRMVFGKRGESSAVFELQDHELSGSLVVFAGFPAESSAAPGWVAVARALSAADGRTIVFTLGASACAQLRITIQDAQGRPRTDRAIECNFTLDSLSGRLTMAFDRVCDSTHTTHYTPGQDGQLTIHGITTECEMSFRDAAGDTLVHRTLIFESDLVEVGTGGRFKAPLPRAYSLLIKEDPGFPVSVTTETRGINPGERVRFGLDYERCDYGEVWVDNAIAASTEAGRACFSLRGLPGVRTQTLEGRRFWAAGFFPDGSASFVSGTLVPGLEIPLPPPSEALREDLSALVLDLGTGQPIKGCVIELRHPIAPDVIVRSVSTDEHGFARFLNVSTPDQTWRQGHLTRSNYLVIPDRRLLETTTKWYSDRSWRPPEGLMKGFEISGNRTPEIRVSR